NVDASVAAELCGKIQPITDLMHQAGAVTNCDWGLGPMTFETLVPHLPKSRAIARTAIWSAAHCRSNDVLGVTEDVLSALRLGKQISQNALIGTLVDMSVQELTASFVATNLDLFDEETGGRLFDAFDDPDYGRIPARVMEQE